MVKHSGRPEHVGSQDRGSTFSAAMTLSLEVVSGWGNGWKETRFVGVVVGHCRMEGHPDDQISYNTLGQHAPYNTNEPFFDESGRCCLMMETHLGGYKIGQRLRSLVRIEVVTGISSYSLVGAIGTAQANPCCRLTPTVSSLNSCQALTSNGCLSTEGGG